MRVLLGGMFKVLAVAIYVIAGLWGFVIELRIVYAVLGGWGVAVGIILAPFLFFLAPIYAGFALGNWKPAILVYGAGIVCWLLSILGAVIAGDD